MNAETKNDRLKRGFILGCIFGFLLAPLFWLGFLLISPIAVIVDWSHHQKIKSDMESIFSAVSSRYHNGNDGVELRMI